jgi:hypothetical protein
LFSVENLGGITSKNCIFVACQISQQYFTPSLPPNPIVDDRFPVKNAMKCWHIAFLEVLALGMPGCAEKNM